MTLLKRRAKTVEFLSGVYSYIIMLFVAIGVVDVLVMLFKTSIPLFEKYFLVLSYLALVLGALIVIVLTIEVLIYNNIVNYLRRYSLEGESIIFGHPQVEVYGNTVVITVENVREMKKFLLLRKLSRVNYPPGG